MASASVVLDASAAAAILFREPDAHLVAPQLFRAGRAIVPQLFHLEIANVGRTKVRRGELTEAQATTLLDTLSTWPLVVRVVSWQDAWRTAFSFGLTVYDAAYLRLAIARRLALLTLDEDLRAAAGRALP